MRYSDAVFAFLVALVMATILAPDLLAGGRRPVAFAGAGAAAALVMAVGARRGFAPVTVVIASYACTASDPGWAARSALAARASA